MFKQPRVPELRDGANPYIALRNLTLFLKDFCQDVWMACRNTDKRLAGITFPVTSVNEKTGDVVLDAASVGALPSGGTAANAGKLDGKTWAALTLEIYPVGAVYISANPTSPASLFAGEWEQLKDRFLLGAGSSYAAGDTGGEAKVTLTTSQIPEHNHPVYSRSVYAGGGSYIGYCNQDNSTDSRVTGSRGGGEAHNNMPPYLTVYMWKRVS